MKTNKNYTWYSLKGGLFNRDYLQQYKEILTRKKTREEVDFIEKTSKLKPGMKILDLCCGHGRHSIELTKRGYNVTGQDINPLFLSEAKKAAKKAGVKIRWIKRDMRKIPFKSEFDVVLNLFTSFGYFEKEEDHQKVIFEIYKSLKPKGIFFLDVINRERLIHKPKFQDRKKFSDGSLLIMRRKFNFLTSRIEEKRIYITKRVRKKEANLNIRIFTLTELISMCQKAGFKFKESYGNYKGEPISFTSRRCILIVQK